jgi:hypothetical protein
LLRLNPPLSVNVIRMHFYFNGFSNETIHIEGFGCEEFCVLLVWWCGPDWDCVRQPLICQVEPVWCVLHVL